MTKKLAEREFTLRAIQVLKDPKYNGIHTVYSGFNQAFRDYFGTDPVAAVDRLVAEGAIDKFLVRGGAMISTKKARHGRQKGVNKNPLSRILKDS